MEETLTEPIDAYAAGGSEPSLELLGSTIEDVKDLGVYGYYGSAGTKYTGIFRDATDGVWKLFTGSPTGPSESVFPDITAYYGTLALGNIKLPDIPTHSTGVNDVMSINSSGEVKKGASNITINAASGELYVAGNLTVTGTITQTEMKDIIVQDPLIKLADNNITSDSYDIGFYGEYRRDGVNVKWSGIVRDASDEEFKLFNGLTSAPSSTSVGDVSLFYGDLRLSSLYATTAISTDSITENTTASGVTVDSVLLKDGNVTLPGLSTPSRLLSCDGSKLLSSTDLSSWVSGTANQLTVSNDSDGTVTLSLPQDIHTTANILFASANLTKVTEQLRLSYDVSNYASFTTSSGGDLTIAPSGGDTNITGNLNVGTSLNYGLLNSRTETRLDAGLRGDAGAQSGFFQAFSGSNYPYGGWFNLIDCRHDNPNNNYALQLASPFGASIQELWYRSTGNNPSQAWSLVATSGMDNDFNFGGNVGIGTGSTISAKLHSLSTGEQLRLGYDVSNYASFTTSSGGDLTIAPSGGDTNITGAVDVSSTMRCSSILVDGGGASWSGWTFDGGLKQSNNWSCILQGPLLSQSTSASSFAGNLTVTGDVTVSGSLTANVTTFGTGADGGVLSWGGSNDTFIYAKSGKSLNLRSNGSTSSIYGISIDTSGNVGIGTNTPSTLLTIQKNVYNGGLADSTPVANAPVLTIQRNQGGASYTGQMATLSFKHGNYDWTPYDTGYITSEVTDVGYGTDNIGADMCFYTKNYGGSVSKKMTLDSTGDVGIGSTVINDPLTVDCANSTNGISAKYYDVGSDIRTVIGHGGNAGGIGSFGGAQISAQGCDNNSNNSGDINFITYATPGANARTDATGATLAMKIKYNGNVGINESSPDTHLHISGTGYNENHGYVKIESDTHASLKLQTTSTSAGTGKYSYIQLVNDANEYEIGCQSTVGLYFNSIKNSGSTNATMVMDSNGNVGVGIDPISKFHVLSSTNANTVILENSYSSFEGTVLLIDSASTHSGAWYPIVARSSAYSITPDNEFWVRGDGQVQCDSSFVGGGADYAEYFESTDGKVIEKGVCIVLENSKVRAYDDIKDKPDDIFGVSRPKTFGKTCASVGNSAGLKWANKYLTDEWGTYELEDYNVYEWKEITITVDEETKEEKTTEETKQWADYNELPDGETLESIQAKPNIIITVQQKKKLNPNYDPEQEYIPREKRDEWILVGLLGQVPVRSDQTVNPRWRKMKEITPTVWMYLIR